MTDQSLDPLYGARERFEHAMMAHGLGGNLFEWVDISAAIDAYTHAVIDFARSSHDSERTTDA